MLAAGGNAVDAVLACAFTQGVVDPLMCGIGGLGSMQVFDPSTGQHVVFDGLSTCPAACTPHDVGSDLREANAPTATASSSRRAQRNRPHSRHHARHPPRVRARACQPSASLPWRDFCDPAIGHAEDGWVVRPHVATMFARTRRISAACPSSQKLAAHARRKKALSARRRHAEALGDRSRTPTLPTR